MNFLDTIKDKLTRLQADPDEEEDIEEADNSESAGGEGPRAPPPPRPDAGAGEEEAEPAATPDAEPEISEEADEGTTEDPGATPIAKPEAPAEEPLGCTTFFGSCEYFTYWQLSIQIVNVFAFFVTVTINFSSQYFMPESLADVTAYWNLPVDPAGWAFSIWGLIYTLLGFFTFYQAIPSGWIEHLGGKRNDDMIFNKMNFIFLFNMICNAAWLPVF